MAVAAFGRWAAQQPPAARFAFALCLSANRAAGYSGFLSYACNRRFLKEIKVYNFRHESFSYLWNK
nr:MAG TPA: hypothetical protein [Caudoviricetes sp.]